MSEPHISCEAEACPFGGDPHDRRSWHIDKRISLDVVLATSAILMAGLSYVLHQDTRVTKVEDRAANLELADLRIEKSVGTQKDDLSLKMNRIEEKLDRLIERPR